MAQAEPKTTKTKASVKAYLDAIEDEQKRKDAKAVDKMLREISGEKPAMWGTGLVGYGTYRYKYASGREGDWPKAAFSARKANLVVYIMAGFSGYDALMKKLGKHKTGVSCLYLNKLADVDQAVLRQLAERSWAYMTKKYG